MNVIIKMRNKTAVAENMQYLSRSGPRQQVIKEVLIRRNFYYEPHNFKSWVFESSQSLFYIKGE